MRGLSKNFMKDLTNSFLSEIINRVRKDKDLDLQIRENYLNIYYKGNSLLKLTEKPTQKYKVEIHEKFCGDWNIPYLYDQQTTQEFLKQLPLLKENSILTEKLSLEIEYEQLLIRANNLEQRNNNEYFIIDRQYTSDSGRFDLMGIFWNGEYRRKDQKVPLCFMEVKFALNSDLKTVHEQIDRYYQKIKSDIQNISQEAEVILKQKLALGLMNKDQARMDAMKTLKISEKIEDVQFIIVLIDYNPRSRLFNSDGLKTLTFANQVRIFSTGFSMWEEKVKSVDMYHST